MYNSRVSRITRLLVLNPSEVNSINYNEKHETLPYCTSLTDGYRDGNTEIECSHGDGEVSYKESGRRNPSLSRLLFLWKSRPFNHWVGSSGSINQRLGPCLGSRRPRSKTKTRVKKEPFFPVELYELLIFFLIRLSCLSHSMIPETVKLVVIVLTEFLVVVVVVMVIVVVVITTH